MKAWKLLMYVFTTFALAYLSGCSKAPASSKNAQSFTELQMQTLSTFEKVDEFPLYEMHFYGEYAPHRLLPSGLLLDNTISAKPQRDPWACTTFAALSDKAQKLFCKNFDWYKDPALLLFTAPQKGYASISLVDLPMLGYSIDKAAAGDLGCLLQAPYFPLDGMNAAGLAVSLMTVSSADSGDDPRKMKIGALDIIRIWLDYASNVSEALKLVAHYNIDFGGRPSHYLVADADGNAATIEFINGEVKVTREHKPWQVAANFTVFTVEPEKRRSLSYRYLFADQELERKQGKMTSSEAFMLLQKVSQDHGPMPTQWSTVYNINTGEVQVAMNRQYDQVYHFTLKMQGK